MLEKLVKKCGDCNLKECIGCEITYSDVKELEKEFDSAGRQGYINGSNASDRVWKKRIQDKIEELDKLIKETQIELGTASKEFTIYVYQRDILKELLEGN